MSLERIAEILHVDEVKLMHGPKGIAVHVRTEKAWHITTIDNADLVKSRGHGDGRTEKQRRLETITEALVHLADGHVNKVRDALSKSVSAQATQAALQADRDAELRRGRGWGTDWFDRPYDGPLRQVQRAEPPAAPSASFAVPEAAPIEPMQSRFHAVMAELGNL